MKKRIVYGSVVMVILLVALFNTYFEIQYGVNLFQPSQASVVLTQGERDWIRTHGKILYGADYSSPPLRYIDENNGQYSGFIVDYISALSVELGIDFELRPAASWDGALLKLQNKETDFVDMIPSPKRAEIYDFSDKVYTLRGAILVRESDESIRNYQDLAGKRVVVPKGDFAHEFLLERVPGIHFIFSQDMKQAVRILQEKKADAVVGDEPVIIYYREILRAKDELKILDDIMYENEACLAVPKDSPMLLSILNKGIRSLERKNLMMKIQQKWFGISIPAAAPDTKKISLLAGIFALVIFFIVYLFHYWNKLLKVEIEKRTAELFVSREQLQTTFDGLPHFLVVVDRQLNIMNVNESFCRVAGLEKEQILGKNLQDFLYIFPDTIPEMIRLTIASGEQYTEEFSRDQNIFKGTAFPQRDNAGQIHSALLMVQDITQVRIGEQQLLQNRKMAAIGQLAAGVAHEIRNPLGLIRNYAYLLKTTSDKRNMDKSIDVIESSVEKAGEIIDNLLNFSRLSCDKIELTDVGKFVSTIVELQIKTQKIDRINCRVHCTKELICRISQEPLKHIMTNLISNAIDAMPDGGDLTIRCYAQEDNLHIECSDTGCGIVKEDADHIFNPFFTTKKPGKGVGLGLYITFNEVQKCGGTIQVQSEPGLGTTFYLILPIKE